MTRYPLLGIVVPAGKVYRSGISGSSVRVKPARLIEVPPPLNSSMTSGKVAPFA